MCLKRGLTRYAEKHVYFTIYHIGSIRQLDCVIFGKSDAAITETAAFFWSLQHPGEGKGPAGLSIDDVIEFDFSSLQLEEIARVLDANPTRHFAFRTGIWNAAQSAVLASRLYPLNLRLSLSPLDMGTFAFTDGGTAFVDALEARNAFFGSLIMIFHTNGVPHDNPFTHVNLKRLFARGDLFETFDRWTWCLENKSAILPFSAKVKTLDCEIDSKYVQPADFASVDIAATDIELLMALKNTKDWEALPVAFLNRVAASGRVERLSLSIRISRKDKADEIVPLASALIRAIRANRQLKHLDVSVNYWNFDYTPYLQDIFEAIEDHSGLRKFVVDISTKCLNDCGLKRLLSRNPNITVCNRSGKTWLSR